MKKIFLILFAIMLACSGQCLRAQTDTLVRKFGSNAANDARIERLLKEDVKKEKKKKDIVRVYFGLAVGYSRFTGGINAPFGKGIHIASTIAKPIIKRRFMLEYTYDLDIYTNGNKQWFGNFMDVPAAGFTRISTGISTGFGASFSVIIFNTHKAAFFAGPVLAAKYTTLPNVDYVQSSESLIDDDFYGLCSGFKATSLVGKHWMFAIEYADFLKKTATHSRPYQSAITIPMNLNLIRFSIGFRI